MISSLKRQDWILNAAILFLALASLLTISGISRERFIQQSIWFAASFLAIIFIAQIDWQPVVNYRWMVFGFYSAVLALLAATLFFAPVIRESRSWLVLGNFQFQPSELAKLALIVMLSYFFSRRNVGIAHIGNLVKSFLYFL